MTSPFVKRSHARWGDMDFNGHMRNTAYLDACGDVRMQFFAEHGFSMREFERLAVGPVILRDELEYFRELRLLEPYDLTLVADGSSEDRSHFRLLNEFRRPDGERCAAVLSTGGWLDLKRRRFTAPPPELAEVLGALPRTAGFAELPSLVRRR
jgi:acyl-CoA thioester hydrolase